MGGGRLAFLGTVRWYWGGVKSCCSQPVWQGLCHVLLLLLCDKQFLDKCLNHLQMTAQIYHSFVIRTLAFQTNNPGD